MATAEATREFSSKAKKMGDEIVALTLKEAKEISDYLEETYDIKAMAGGPVMMAGPAGGAATEAPVAKTEFDVVLDGCDQLGGSQRGMPLVVIPAGTKRRPPG